MSSSVLRLLGVLAVELALVASSSVGPVSAVQEADLGEPAAQSASPGVGAEAGDLAVASERSDRELVTVPLTGKPVETRTLLGGPLHEADATWSPDGTRVAFSRSDEPDHWVAGIWVSAPDGTQLRRVTPEDRGHYGKPDWSPDGKTLAFEGPGEAGSGRAIWTAPADAGAVAERRTAGTGSSTSPAWSPDGTWIAYAHQDSARAGVYRVRADEDRPVKATGEAVTVMSSPGPVELAWDPAGSETTRQRIVFSIPRGTSEAEQQLCLTGAPTDSVVAASGSGRCGNAATPIQSAPKDARDPIWTTAGFVYVSHRGEAISTVRVVKGSDPGAHFHSSLNLPWTVHATDLSPDGLLAFDTWLPGGTVHLVSPDGSGHRELGLPGLLDPAWSPDGRTLAVTTRGPDGRRQLAVVRPDGSGLAELSDETLAGSDVSHPQWSPGGGELVVRLHQPNGVSGLAVVDAGTGELIRRLTHDGSDAHPDWSPDGERIAFSRDEGKQRLVLEMPAAGGEPTFRSRGELPAWHPTPPRLALVDGRRILSLTDEGDPPETVLEVEADGGLAHAPDGAGLAYSAYDRDSYRDHVVVRTFGDPGTTTTVLEGRGPYGRPSWRSSATLSLEYAADRPSPAVGDEVRWTATVTNRGPVGLRRATLTLAPPTGAPVLAVSGDGCAPLTTGNDISCALGPLAPQDTTTVVLTTRALRGRHSSQAVVGDGDPVDPEQPSRTATAVVEGVSPALGLTKTADAERVALGGDVTYRVGIDNTGNQVAREAVLVDELPDEMSLLDVEVEPEDGAECTAEGRRVRCEVPQLEPDDRESDGGVVVVLTARVDRMPETADGSITNTATVDLVDDGSDDGSDDADGGGEVEREVEPSDATAQELAGTSASASATVYVDRPELVVRAVADPGEVSLGGDSVVRLAVTNSGRAPARKTELEVRIPEGLELRSAPGCRVEDHAVACALGTLEGGGTAARTLEVRAQDVGTQQVSAQVATDSPGDEPTGNAAAVDLLVVAPDLVVDKRGPEGAVPVGGHVHYVLEVRNRGTSAAEGVRLVDPLALGLELVAVQPADLCRPDRTGVVCGLGTVGPSATTRVEVTARATDFGVVRNTATVTSRTRQSSTDNDSGHDDVDIVPPDLAVAGTAPADVGVRTPVPVVVSVGNAGAASAADVTVSASWDAAALELVTAPAGCTPSRDGAAVQCRLGAIAAGATAQSTLVVRARTTGSATIALSTATPTPERDLDDNRTELALTVRSPRLQVDLAAPATVDAGDDIAYEVTVSNDGDWPTSEVRLRDVLPAGTDLADSDRRCALAARTLTCSVGIVDPGSSRTLRLALRAPRPGVVVNTVLVGSATAGQDGDPVTATVTTRVLAADLAVSLSAFPDAVALDGSTTITAVASSSGPDRTGGVVLTLPLPVGAGMPGEAPDGCALADRIVTCALRPLGPGEDQRVTVELTALAIGTLPVEVHVAGDVVDLVPANDRATAHVVVVPPRRVAPTTPSLVVSPSQSYAGFVVQARGAGFPARAVVRLRWTPGIVPPVAGGVVTTDADGRFTAPVVLAPNDVLGQRRLVAQVDGGPPVEVPFLLGPRPVQPPLLDRRGGRP